MAVFGSAGWVEAPGATMLYPVGPIAKLCSPAMLQDSYLKFTKVVKPLPEHSKSLDPSQKLKTVVKLPPKVQML